jgi:hypothetical protein
MAGSSNDEQALSEFLHWVASERQDLIELWRTSDRNERNKKVVKHSGKRLRRDHYEALVGGDPECIAEALKKEWKEAGLGADVEAHGNPHFGPCWILVG